MLFAVLRANWFWPVMFCLGGAVSSFYYLWPKVVIGSAIAVTASWTLAYLSEYVGVRDAHRLLLAKRGKEYEDDLALALQSASVANLVQTKWFNQMADKHCPPVSLKDR